MKVTAIIDDLTIREAIKYSHASSITDALKVALHVYISQEKLKELGKLVKKSPLHFDHPPKDIRDINRKHTKK